MTKPPRAAIVHVLPWSIGLLLSGFGFAFALSDHAQILYSVAFLFPVISAYLGVRFGRRSLVALGLAAPFLLLNFGTDPDAAAQATFGIFESLLLVGVALLWNFSGHSDRREPHVRPEQTTSPSSPILFITILLVLGFSISLNIYAEPGGSHVAYGAGTSELSVAIAFLFAASGRIELRHLLIGAIGVALATNLVTTSAIVHIEKCECLDWYDDYSFFDWWFLDRELRPDIVASGRIIWRSVADFEIAYICASGMLGLVLRPVWLHRGVPANDGRNVMLLSMAVFFALFGPGAFHYLFEQLNLAVEWGYNLLLSGVQPKSSVDTGADAFAIITQKREQSVLDVILNPLAISILAGVAFVSGTMLADFWKRFVWTSIIAISAVVAKLAYLGVHDGRAAFGDAATVACLSFIGVFSAAGLMSRLGAFAARSSFAHQVENSTFELPGDVTHMADIVHELDKSATLRAFTLVVLILIGWGGVLASATSFWAFPEIVTPLDAGNSFLVALSLALGFIAPFGFLVMDLMARQPMRLESSVLRWLNTVAAVLFALLFLFLAANVIRYVAAQLGLTSPEELEPLSDADIRQIAFMTLFVVLGLWTTIRRVRIERVLSKPTPRPILLGSILDRTLGRHLGFLFGLPSVVWRWRKLIFPSSWLFLLSRPLVYVGVLLTANVISVQETIHYDGWNDEPDVSVSVSPHAFFYMSAGLMIVLMGHAAFLWAKRIASSRIWDDDASGRSGKRPILFLRSFEDDQLDFKRSWKDPFGRWVDLWSFRRNVDELLVDEFEQYGPIIALGKPGDKQRKFGASRKFSTHQEWKSVVRNAAHRAQAIIVAAGETPGLLWEYDLIRNASYLEKTLFLFPPSSVDVPRAKAALDLFLSSFPEARDVIDPDSCPLALSYHDGRWHATITRTQHAQSCLLVLRAFFQSENRLSR
tara:strand:- start:1080 stop:3869 length:2790 start_codon:yes stop_codon:yes gene_type:complete